MVVLYLFSHNIDSTCLVDTTRRARIEGVGGILLILGLLTPVVAVLVVVVMIGAFFFVHIGSGVYVTNNGWELVAVIGLAVVVYGLVGPGRYSLDALIAGRRTAKV